MRQKYSGDDVRSRLNGTVIRYKGHPYLVEVENHSSLSLYGLDGGGLIVRVDSDDKDIDISSCPLGYVNIDHPDYKLAVYLKREAFRQFKQGVDLARLTQFPLRTGVSQLHNKILHCRGLVDCVLDRYPNFQKAMDWIVKKGFHSVALSRNVAVKRENNILKVFVKGEEVGWIKMGTDTVIVPKTEISSYCKQYIQLVDGWKIKYE